MRERILGYLAYVRGLWLFITTIQNVDRRTNEKIILSLFAAVFLLSGCFNMKEQTAEEKAQKGTTPVQDYIGQGYSFVDGNKSAERVKKHEEEIKQEAINYMKTKYKTDVKVNNVVPARNGAVVIVESETPVQFTTSVTVKFILNRKDELGSGTSHCRWTLRESI